MLLLHLSIHRCKQLRRLETFGRSMWSVLFVVLIGTYFAVMLGSAGFAYPQIVQDLVPERDPIRLLNRHLLTAFLGFLVARFFLQRSPTVNLQPYLHLPVRRASLVRFVQGVRIISLLNVLPLFFFVPLWIHIAQSTMLGMTGAMLWGGGILLLVLLTHYTNTLLRILLNQRVGLFLSIAGVLVGALVLDEVLGLQVLPHASTWLFDRLLTGHAAPLLLLSILTVGTVLISNRLLRQDLRTPEFHKRVLWNTGGSFSGSSSISALILLDLKSIVRNKRPRQMLLGMSLLTIALVLLIFSSEEMVDPLMQVFIVIYLTGLVPLTYGQLVFAWDSPHFDWLMARRLSPSTLIRARLLLLQGFCTICFLAALPFLAWFAPQLIALSFAFLFYNTGVSCVLAILAALWNRRRVILSRSTFLNHQGFSVQSYIFLFLLLIPPTVLPILLDKPYALLVIASIGLLGLVLTPLWTCRFSYIFERRRYIMAAGFRQVD